PRFRPADAPVANTESSPVSQASPIGFSSRGRFGNNEVRSSEPHGRLTKLGASRAGTRPGRLAPEVTWPFPPWKRIFRGAADPLRFGRSTLRRKAGCAQVSQRRRREPPQGAGALEAVCTARLCLEFRCPNEPRRSEMHRTRLRVRRK